MALWGQFFHECGVNIGGSAQGLLLPPAKRNVPLIMKRHDRSIFLTPRLSWYRCRFLLQPEACGRSSGLASECHLGRRGVSRNWSRGVMDYNRRKPKYERGMLTGRNAKDWGFRRRVLGRGVTPIGEVVLTVIQIFWWFGKHVYLLSANLRLLHFNPNEDKVKNSKV